MAHRIREAMKMPTRSGIGSEGKVVEADETYIGGKEHNKYANKRLRRHDLKLDAKQAVFTLLERDGRAGSLHVAIVTSKMLRTAIVTSVRRESHLMTDGHLIYPKIGAEFSAHSAVNHQEGEYVRDGFHHSNTVENYFSILKHGIAGVYHHVSEAHLQRYLAEFDFRYSYRQGMGVDDAARTDEMLKGSTGKRLTYRRTRQAAYA